MADLDKNECPLLEEVTEGELDYLNTLEMQMEAEAALEKDGIQKYKLILAKHFLIICELEEGDEKVVAMIRLRVQLKLQKINIAMEEDNSAKPKGTSKEKLVGFTISGKLQQSISFYLEPSSLAELWFRRLSKHLSQPNLHKNFAILKRLGKGNSASVYECCRVADNEKFAVKVYPRSEFKSEKKKKTLRNQLRILRDLDNACFLHFQGVYEDETNFYVIMEKLMGNTLYNCLATRSSPIGSEQIKIIMRGLLSNLNELSELNIVHRDVKLENIVFRNTLNTMPVIIDYEYAVYADDEDYVHYKCGTPGYLSPEVLLSMSNEKLTDKCDVFSVGCVFHVLLTGRFIFKGKDAKQIYLHNKAFDFDFGQPEYNGIDQLALDLLRKMMEIDPKSRFSAQQCLNHDFLLQKGGQDEEKLRKNSTSTQNQEAHQLLM